jgi:catechol 2,3-dioxygenase-like lactoylglutathione lyase family enzyme
MTTTTVLGVHPVIPAKDMNETLAFYVDRLGFTKTFDDAAQPGDPITYAGISREGFTFHLQAMVSGQSDAMPLIRIHVTGIEALHDEYHAEGVVAESGSLRTTPWGTMEFGLYDPNGAALIYYEDHP